jgi:hypothetical protein
VNVLNAVAGCKQGPSFGHITLALESELLLSEPARLAVGTLTSECGRTSSTVKSKSEPHDCHPLIHLLIFIKIHSRANRISSRVCDVANSSRGSQDGKLGRSVGKRSEKKMVNFCC